MAKHMIDTESLNPASEAHGLILNVHHGTTKDGPGWRSIVYFMGCNLRCLWCSSPHTIPMRRSLLLYPKLEKYPAITVATCPHRAITLSLDGESSATDRSQCTGCATHDCVASCPDGSRESAGYLTTSGQLLAEIAPYRQFHPKYGVTISGGEPTVQWDFFTACLSAFRSSGLHTAVETNATSPRLTKALPLLDLVICDLKHFDDDAHIRITGHSNRQVIANITAIAAAGHPLWVRIPVIPTLNDGDNLVRSADFLASIASPGLSVEILGFHKLGEHYWHALGKQYPASAFSPLSEPDLAACREIFSSRGLDVLKT